MINLEKIARMPLIECENAVDNGQLGAYGEYIKKYRDRGNKPESTEAEARLKLAVAVYK